MPRKHGKPTKASANGLSTDKPLARSDELVVEELGDELLVYDLTANRAHSLGVKAARVWRACDGKGTADAVSARSGLDADTTARALAELRACALLDGEPPVDSGNGMTRRQMTFKVAQVGATAAAVPLIWSIAGPIPEAAATPTPAQCLLYVDKDCSNCKNICGCCCCGQAGGGGVEPSCKVCFTISGCPTFTLPGGGTGKCSAKAGSGCTQAADSYTCKDGKVVTLAGTERCCDYKAG